MARCSFKDISYTARITYRIIPTIILRALACTETRRRMPVPLLRLVEIFLRETGMPRTRFGRLSAGDPRLVDDLRRGREPREALRNRIEHFMNIYRQEQA